MSEVRKKRASRPKSKTGCITCKSRKVRCDEAKPSCNRCLRLNRECEGYEVKIPWRQSSPKKSTSKVTESSPRILMPKPLVSFNLRFENEEDSRYFEFFRENTATSLSGVFKSDLWTEIVLQFSETASFVKPAIIAIGALDRAGETLAVSLPGHRPHVDKHTLQRKGHFHHQYALQQYSIALRLMRESTATRSDYTLHLISCLFTTCFELFYGNLKSAQALASSGIKLFHDRPGEVGTTGETSSRIASSGLDRKVEDTLIDLFDHIYKGHAFRSKGAQEFERHLSLYADGERKLYGMPHEFTSITDARLYRDLMAKQAILWKALKRFEHPRLRSISVIVAKNGSLEIPANYLPLPEALAAELDEEHKKAVSLEEKWRIAFQPIFQRSRTTAGKDDFVGASILAISTITAPYTGFPDDFESEVDLVLNPPENLSDVVSLARDVLEHLDEGTAKRATFTFDSGFVPKLMIVAKKSRDPNTRSRAIALIEQYLRREGLWDSSIRARIAIIKLEDRRQYEILLEKISTLKDAGIKNHIPYPTSQSSKQRRGDRKRVPLTTVVPVMVLKIPKRTETFVLS